MANVNYQQLHHSIYEFRKIVTWQQIWGFISQFISESNSDRSL